MFEFLNILGSLLRLFLGLLEQIRSYFSIALEAFKYLINVVAFLPLYIKAFVICLIAVSVLLFILNRGA